MWYLPRALFLPCLFIAGAIFFPFNLCLPLSLWLLPPIFRDKIAKVFWQKIESGAQSVYCLHLNKSNNKWHFNAVVMFFPRRSFYCVCCFLFRYFKSRYLPYSAQVFFVHPTEYTYSISVTVFHSLSLSLCPSFGLCFVSRARFNLLRTHAYRTMRFYYVTNAKQKPTAQSPRLNTRVRWLISPFICVFHPIRFAGSCSCTLPVCSILLSIRLHSMLNHRHILFIFRLLLSTTLIYSIVWVSEWVSVCSRDVEKNYWWDRNRATQSTSSSMRCFCRSSSLVAHSVCAFFSHFLSEKNLVLSLSSSTLLIRRSVSIRFRRHIKHRTLCLCARK